MTSPQIDGALPPVSPRQRELVLGGLLKAVSRSFYLTLRVLPKDLREPVGLAYLLARAADTIADTRLLPSADRLEHLQTFRDQVTGPARLSALHRLGNVLTSQRSIPAERTLLSSLPEAFSLLEGLSEGDGRRVRWVLQELMAGMEFDLANFPGEDSGKIGTIENDAILDGYAYQVAGCVGRFWTEISMDRVSRLDGWDPEKMAALGVRFGKALQLTNVLRDVPKDLRIGRCYLPLDQLDRIGVAPDQLLDPQTGPKARPVLLAGIETALGHYSAAEEYILAIPRRCLRLRLAALWPVLIGLGTLSRLARNQRWLDPETPSRVSRRWVYAMMALSFLAVNSNLALRAWIGRLRRNVEAGIS
ncbi:MAG: squalene/phytoene synthase family protein [Chloroflexi bacterium]|nr:squalene/phytoene synthase family protein [Chloroflexota bacterium]